MNFSEFTEAVKAGLEALFQEEDVEIGISRVTKNNGLILTGVNIRERDAALAPTIYLNEFYREAISKTDIDDIALQIRQIYLARSHGFARKTDVERYQNFDWVQDKIIYTLVNSRMNEERLKTAPYIPFHDLAILFRCVFHVGPAGVASTVVSNEDLKRWKIDTKRLYQLAMENTPRLFPPVVEKVTTYLAGEMGCSDLLHADFPEEAGELFVMSNQMAVNGAAVMLYPGLLERCAERVGDDFYILPSSIHELIFVSEGKATDAKTLSDIVHEVNDKMVNRAELLSNQIYRYNRAAKKVEMYHEN